MIVKMVCDASTDRQDELWVARVPRVSGRVCSAATKASNRYRGRNMGSETDGEACYFVSDLFIERFVLILPPCLFFNVRQCRSGML